MFDFRRVFEVLRVYLVEGELFSVIHTKKKKQVKPGVSIHIIKWRAKELWIEFHNNRKQRRNQPFGNFCWGMHMNCFKSWVEKANYWVSHITMPFVINLLGRRGTMPISSSLSLLRILCGWFCWTECKQTQWTCFTFLFKNAVIKTLTTLKWWLPWGYPLVVFHL